LAQALPAAGREKWRQKAFTLILALEGIVGTFGNARIIFFSLLFIPSPIQDLDDVLNSNAIILSSRFRQNIYTKTK